MTSPDRNEPGEEEHPRSALLFILIYLVIIVFFWLNTYLRLWMRD